jgi:hypothetical protein
VYYGDNLDKERADRIRFALLQNSGIQTILTNGANYRCRNAVLLTEMISIVHEEDGRVYSEVGNHTGEYASSDPNDKNSHWQNPYSLKLDEDKTMLRSSELSTRGRRFTTETGTKIVFSPSSAAPLDTFTVIAEASTIPRLNGLLTCKYTSVGTTTKFHQISPGDILTLPITCGFVSLALNITGMTLDWSEEESATDILGNWDQLILEDSVDLFENFKPGSAAAKAAMVRDLAHNIKNPRDLAVVLNKIFGSTTILSRTPSWAWVVTGCGGTIILIVAALMYVKKRGKDMLARMASGDVAVTTRWMAKQEKKEKKLERHATILKIASAQKQKAREKQDSASSSSSSSSSSTDLIGPEYSPPAVECKPEPEEQVPKGAIGPAGSGF